MLRELVLHKFKSFVAQTVPLSPLTLLVGANGSGKSNVFDSMRVIQGIGLGLSFSEIFSGRYEGGREVWSPIRGGLKESCIAGESIFYITAQWVEAEYAVFYTLGCETVPEAASVAEMITQGLPEVTDLVNPVSKSLGKNVFPQPGNFFDVALASDGQGRKCKARISTHRSLLNQLQPQPRVRPEVYQSQAYLLDRFRRCIFLDLNPSLMRSYVPKGADELGLSGQNLSAVLWKICQDPQQRDLMQDWLTEVCAPELSALSFSETDLGDVMLKVQEGSGHWVSARSLSDGTLRFLGLLVALHTAKPGTTLLIEEVDNGLHPSRISLLLQLLTTYTSKKNIQVIATTHSPYLLSQLPKDRLAECVLLARTPESKGTVVRRFGELPHFEEVVRQDNFAHLFTTSWLEREL